jgi:hypothetical protein
MVNHSSRRKFCIGTPVTFCLAAIGKQRNHFLTQLSIPPCGTVRRPPMQS